MESLRPLCHPDPRGVMRIQSPCRQTRRSTVAPGTAWVAKQPYVSVPARPAHKSGREYEDLVAVTGQLADGTVTSHLVSSLSPMKERITVVSGDRGTFVADTLHADLPTNGVGPTESGVC